MYSEINEKFTDEEMELENQFKNVVEEMNSVHKGANYSVTQEGNEHFYSHNNILFGQGIGNKLEILEEGEESGSHLRRMQQQNLLLSNQQDQAKMIDTAMKLPLSMSFQTAMQKVESVYSAQDKLQIVQHYCLQIKSQVVTIEQKQRDFLLQMIQPIIKNINADPTQHNQCTLYALLNIAREDFLNFPLNNRVLSHIKYLISKNYDTFEIDKIKQVFYASCMKHKDSTYSIIEPMQLRCWFSKIHTKILENQVNEREMILFMSYHHKDIDLFRKTHKFISHILLSQSQDCVILKSKNAELLKVFISIYCKNEKGSQQLYEMFMLSLQNLIQNDLLSISQFQVILRNLLRSHMFHSFRVISSFAECKELPVESTLIPSESASESDGEKSDGSSGKQYQQEDQQQIKRNAEQNSQQQSYFSKQNFSFKVIDQFVQDKLDQMSSNQLLNVLNLYQIINAQNYRSTVIKLLDQLKSRFNSNCDNHFSFNITVRSLCLFEIENPEYYLSVYQSSPSKLVNTNYSMQIAVTFNMLKELLPSIWNKEYQEVYQVILKEIQKDVQKITQTQIKNQQYTMTPEKRRNIQTVQQIFDNLHINYSTQQNVETCFVDFFVKISTPNFTKLKFPNTPFTLDVMTPRDEMAAGIFNGPISLKIKLLTKLKIPNIQLKEDFFTSIAELSPYDKERALFEEINEQLKNFN